VTLFCDLLTLKVVPESRVTWATSVPILVFLDLSVLDLGPMYATVKRQTDRRQTDVSQHHRLTPGLLEAGHNNIRWDLKIPEPASRGPKRDFYRPRAYTFAVSSHYDDIDLNSFVFIFV